MMNYEQYKKYYHIFSSPERYYDACDFLAFKNNPWVGFAEYKKLLKNSIQKTSQRMGKKLIAGDFCCGQQLWLAYYFSVYMKAIFCVDQNQNSFLHIAKLKLNSTKIYPFVGDASVISLPKRLDFLYCGFNVYAKFVPNFFANTKKGGCIFLMKPKIGDDLTLRARISNYSLQQRIKEIKKITEIIKKRAEVNYFEVKYYWIYPVSFIDKLLAGLCVVTMGEPTLLSEPRYKFALRFLRRHLYNNTIVLSQVISIWEAIKR